MKQLPCPIVLEKKFSSNMLKFVGSEEGKTARDDLTPVLSVSRDSATRGQLKLQVPGGMKIDSNLEIEKLLTVPRIQISDKLKVGYVDVDGSLSVNKAATFEAHISAKASLSVSGTLICDGKTVARGGLNVTGGGSIRGGLTVTGGLKLGKSNIEINNTSQDWINLKSPKGFAVKINNENQLRVTATYIELAGVFFTRDQMRTLKLLAEGRLKVLVKSQAGHVLDNLSNRTGHDILKPSIQFQKLDRSNINKAWKMTLEIVK